jgi:hypothetical protein
MKKKNIILKRLILCFSACLLITGAVGALMPGFTYAATKPDGCNKESTSIINVDCSGNDGKGIWGLLSLILNIMTAGIAIAAVIGISIAAVIYITAEGNAERAKKAKVWIFNVVLGLVLYGLLYAIMQFFIPGGVFS